MMNTKNFLFSVCAAVLAAGCAGDASDVDYNTDGDKNDTLTGTRQRIDRIGRPEITNFTIRAPAFKTPYNAEDTFTVSADKAPVEGGPTYAQLLTGGVMAWDAFDGIVHWEGKELATLVSWLAKDYLLVDISKPCDVNSATYLEIEYAVALGKDHVTCGGRLPNDDVIDRYMNLLIGGIGSDGRHGDGVDAPATAATNTFPYLTKPVDPPPAPPAPEEGA